MIVGLGHVKRSGKDSAANALVERLGFRRDSFADDVRRFALALDPWILHECHHLRLSTWVELRGWEGAKEIPEVRKLLQDVGSEARNILGSDIWIRKVIDRLALGEHVVIPDVRFVNEAEAIQALGGWVIRIDRPGHVAEGHVSETALADWDGWDGVICNDGTLDDLAARICAFVQHPSVASGRPAGAVAPVAPLAGQECWEVWTALAERAHMTWGSLSPDARALWDSFASALTTRTAPA